MNKLRLKTIASFIEQEDRVADIGCDHAYLSIYLVQNKMCQSVIASDINSNALENAIQNIKKEKLEKQIPVVLSNGLENISQNEVDTLVLSGMGTSTILRILKKVHKDKIKKIIVQSNNDLYELRKKMKEYGYFLQQEDIVYEGKHYYCIGKYEQKPKALKKVELYFGLYQEKNKDYYEFLQKELYTIYGRVNWKHPRKKLHLLYKLHLLKKYL